MPELAKVAQQVYVFQRTPQWILPRSDKPFTEEQKRRFARNPIAATAPPPGALLGLREHHRLPPRRTTGAEQLKALALSHIDYRIKDDELRAKLTPDYPFGCKRTLVCSDFYKALLRDNVELVTERHRSGDPGLHRHRRRPGAAGGRHRAGHRVQGDRVPRRASTWSAWAAAACTTTGPRWRTPTWA